MKKTSQAEELTKIWAEAQQKMWTQWFELAQKSPATDIFDQWQATLSGNLDNWMDRVCEWKRSRHRLI